MEHLSWWLPFGACIWISVCFLCIWICKASLSLLALTRALEWDSGTFGLLPLQAKRGSSHHYPKKSKQVLSTGGIPKGGGSQKQWQEIRRGLGRVSVLSTVVYLSSNILSKQMPEWSFYNFNLTVTPSYLKPSVAPQPLRRKARLFHHVRSQLYLTRAPFTTYAAESLAFPPRMPGCFRSLSFRSNFFLSWSIPLFKEQHKGYPPCEIFLAPFEPSSKLKCTLLCGLTLTCNWCILPTTM